MAQLAEIQMAQSTLEESLSKIIAHLEAQLHSGGNSKDTVARVSEEFRIFWEFMFKMLGLLRKQINEGTKLVDVIETRYHRKALIFLGVPVAVGEECS